MTLEQALDKIATLQEKIGNQESELTTLRKVKTDLEADVKTARDKNKSFETEVADLKGKLPSADSVVLKKSDFEAVEAKAKTVDTLTQENRSLRASNLVRGHVKDKNVDAILAHTPSDGLWEEYETKDKDNKPLKSLRLVQTVNGKEEKTPLADWLETTSKTKFVDFSAPNAEKAALTTKGIERNAATSGGTTYAEKLPNPF